MNSLCKKVFKDLLCTNNVSFSGYGGRTQRSVVFTNPKVPGENYVWITTAGREFIEGQYYNIRAECDARGILKRVKEIEPPVKPHLKVDIDEEIANSWNASIKSEQPDHSPANPVDIFDLIFDTSDTHLTND